MQLEQPRYTYVLRSPVDQTPIYVGMGAWDRTSGSKHRYQNSAIGAHVRELESQGLKVVRERMGPFSRDEAYEFEALLIDEIGRRDLGTGPLFNLRTGGRKVHQSDATRAKLSASHMGKTLSEEHKQAISATLKGRRPSVEHCRRHSMIMKEWWTMRKSNQVGK